MQTWFSPSFHKKVNLSTFREVLEVKCTRWLPLSFINSLNGCLILCYMTVNICIVSFIIYLYGKSLILTFLAQLTF